jgi:hypothetical protein
LLLQWLKADFNAQNSTDEAHKCENCSSKENGQVRQAGDVGKTTDKVESEAFICEHFSSKQGKAATKDIKCEATLAKETDGATGESKVLTEKMKTLGIQGDCSNTTNPSATGIHPGPNQLPEILVHHLIEPRQNRAHPRH